MSDTPSCWSESKPRARKPHKCCECRGVIKSGETYVRFSGVWTGEADTFKTCLECDALRSEVDSGVQLDERTPFGHLHETVFERRMPGEMRRYIETMEKRGATVPEWMHRTEKAALAQFDELKKKI